VVFRGRVDLGERKAEGEEPVLVCVCIYVLGDGGDELGVNGHEDGLGVNE
jgi:hypothetical protein